MICKLITYGSFKYKEMVSLRDKIQREPLSLTFSQEDLLNDKNDILIGCFEKSTEILTGCCILSQYTEDSIQLRQMAVDIHFQQSKFRIGSQLISFVEKLAKDKGYKYIYLHAREVAIDFYTKSGYSIISNQFEEVGIPHFEMKKII